jgi:hypothetical protein
VLLLDGEPGVLRADEPFDVIEPSELSIAPVELQRMAAMYTVTELATAVKPWLLELLLAGPAATAACYLDPDVRLFAGLDDLD